MKKILEYKYFIILIINILIIRAFIIEPFRIPSGSMIPTLMIGDFIFVNKFIYGIKIPFTNKNIININTIKRGDVIVFKHKNGKKYIKRVIGLDGDNIEYTDKTLTINNKIIRDKKIINDIDFENNNIILESIEKQELISPIKEYKIKEYKNINNNYNYTKITVPNNSYFVMGDNRDNSEDSRVWGFVEKNDVIGQAFMIWLSFDFKTKTIRTKRFLKNIK